MKLWVIRCYFHIVGVFSTKEKAEAAEKRHAKYKHLHYACIYTDTVELDEYQKSFEEDKKV